MASLRAATFRAVGVAAAIGVALSIAACGSSGSSSSNTPAAGGYGAASQPAAATGSSLTIGTTKGSAGTYLTGASGRALYLWAADSGDKSSCSGACASTWPPVIAKSLPSVSGGASAAELNLITRSDGSKQVAYKGHPLYYYAEDSKAGTTSGEGSNSFGARWWLVSTSGTGITTGASSSNASSSSGGSSTSSSGGSSGGSSWG